MRWEDSGEAVTRRDDNEAQWRGWRKRGKAHSGALAGLTDVGGRVAVHKAMRRRRC